MNEVRRHLLPIAECFGNGEKWWPGAESNHRHADFQSGLGSPEALYFKELPGRPLPNLHHDAGLRTASSRKIHAATAMEMNVRN